MCIIIVPYYEKSLSIYLFILLEFQIEFILTSVLKPQNYLGVEEYKFESLVLLIATSLNSKYIPFAP